jgi:hypothetical protein
MFHTFVLLTVVMVSATAAVMNSTDAQQRQSSDSPFVVVFTIAGVDNSTGELASWVTVNNITRSTFYNASQIDLLDANAHDGFIDASVTLPNGTLAIGDEYTACTVILKDKYLTCNAGFNAPTNRAEFVDVMIPSSRGK